MKCRLFTGSLIWAACFLAACNKDNSSTGDSPYKGDIRDDKRDGLGVNDFTNGDRYAGEWEKDKREGRGLYLHSNGEAYLGTYAADNKNGPGISNCVTAIAAA